MYKALIVIGGLNTVSDKALASKNQTLLSNQPSSATVAQRSNSGQFTAMEQSVHQQINQYRKSRKLPSLTFDARIAQQARNHSQAMASGRVPFSHNGFDGRVKAIAQVIRFNGAAENVAYNRGASDPGKKAVQGWLNSTGHRKNIEGNFDLTGIGIAKNAKGDYYFTQIFIKQR
jgi:uncharacterized protein YkwD